MRPYLSFPRAARTPSPRILFYASDLPALAARDLDLAAALAAELPHASLVLATGAPELFRAAPPPRVEVVKVPGPGAGTPLRPLAHERVRRLRQRLLATLFDVYQPDLLLLDMVGPEAELEARLLLDRARAMGSATLLGVSHEHPGQACHPLRPGACASCRQRTCSAVREALAERERRGD